MLKVLGVLKGVSRVPGNGVVKEATAGAKDPAAAKPPPRRRMRIDFDKIGQRILALPLHRAAMSDCRQEEGRAPRARPRVSGAGAGGPGAHRASHALRERRTDVVASGVHLFEVSANGEKILTTSRIAEHPGAAAGPDRTTARPAPPGRAGQPADLLPDAQHDEHRGAIDPRA